jgi:hypothetical protein
VGGVAEGVMSVVGVTGGGVSLAAGVLKVAVALGPATEGEGEGEDGASVGVREGVTPGGIVAEGVGGADEAVGDGGVFEGRTRVAVGGMGITLGT